MVKFRGEREIIFPERGGDAKFFLRNEGGTRIFFQLSEGKKGGGKEKNKKNIEKKKSEKKGLLNWWSTWITQ